MDGYDAIVRCSKCKSLMFETTTEFRGLLMVCLVHLASSTNCSQDDFASFPFFSAILPNGKISRTILVNQEIGNINLHILLQDKKRI